MFGILFFPFDHPDDQDTCQLGSDAKVVQLLRAAFDHLFLGCLVVELLRTLRKNCHINESRLRLSVYSWAVRLEMLIDPTIQDLYFK